MPNIAIFAFDLVAIAILTCGLYFRRHRRREMVVAYVALNAGALALAATLTEANVGTGLGLGLFGVLSIIRLRSSEITHEEVAYYFVALSLGLLAGFQPDPQWLAPGLGTMLVAAIYVADHPGIGSRNRRQLITLDAAYADEAKLIARLEELLDADVTHVIVNQLDLVRDSTVVDVRFRRRAASKAAAPTTAHATDNHRTHRINGHATRPLTVAPARQPKA